MVLWLTGGLASAQAKMLTGSVLTHLSWHCLVPMRLNSPRAPQEGFLKLLRLLWDRCMAMDVVAHLQYTAGI